MKIFLRGEGKVQDPMEEMTDEVLPTTGSIEYGTSVKTGDNAMPPEPIRSPEEKIKTDPVPPVSNDPGFDVSAIQDARRDTDIEGGVTNPARSTGPMVSNGDAASEGGIITREPLSDSTPGAYELSGFHVEMKTTTGMVSIQVTQDFKDEESAKLSINGDKYLMPVKTGGFNACRITRGAPILCFDERQIAEYIDGKWRRS